MNANPKSTKEEIIALLKAKRQLTVMEMAKALCITEMAVRRHIGKLEKEQLVQATLMRQHVGRPTYVYELSARGEDLFPKQYKEFAIGMLHDLLEMGRRDVIEQLLQSRTERMKQQLGRRLIGKPLSLKLKEIVFIQKENGYMPEMKVQPDGTFLLTKKNCPLLSIAQQFPEICEREEDMYRQLMPEAHITPVTCAADNGCACVYEIQEQ